VAGGRYAEAARSWVVALYLIFDGFADERGHRGALFRGHEAQAMK
jgi:hypothetical protein